MSLFGDLDRQLAEICRLLVDADGNPMLADLVGNSRLQRIERRLSGIENQLDQILEKEKKIMANLADLQAAVTAEDTVVDSAITLLQGLAAQVAALKPDQAAIDALAADIGGKTAALAEAVAANTAPSP